MRIYIISPKAKKPYKEKHMSLVASYLANNGYDYYGNAAEDTLVFFVRDKDAPTAGKPKEKSNIINRDDAPAHHEYNEAPVSGSLLSPGSDVDDRDASDSIPKMQPVDEKQTEAKRDTDFKA